MGRSRIRRKDIDFSRGDEDIAFIHTEIEIEEISEKDNPQEELLEEMEKLGLEVQNAEVIGIFSDEFSLLLKDGAKIILDGEQLYPGRKDE